MTLVAYSRSWAQRSRSDIFGKCTFPADHANQSMICHQRTSSLYFLWYAFIEEVMGSPSHLPSCLMLMSWCWWPSRFTAWCKLLLSGLLFFLFTSVIMSSLKKAQLLMQRKSDHMFTLAKTVLLWVANYIVMLWVLILFVKLDGN